MALQNTYILKKGSTLKLKASDLPDYAESGYIMLSKDIIKEKQYYKILNTNVYTIDSDTLCDITVGIFENSNSDVLNNIAHYTFNIDKQGDNFIKQGYEYLKTLEEFKDAEDC